MNVYLFIFFINVGSILYWMGLEPKSHINIAKKLQQPGLGPKSFQYLGKELTTRPDKFFGHIIIFIILIIINIINTY